MGDLVPLNEVVPFGDGEVRVVAVDGETCFLAKGVCGVLGHSNTWKAVSGLDDDEHGVTFSYSVDKKGVRKRRKVAYVTESGLYHLIVKSRVPAAKKFRRWVTEEVLPAIRKAGRYERPVPPRNAEELGFGVGGCQCGCMDHERRRSREQLEELKAGRGVS